MRIILSIGATICCIIGLFTFVKIVSEIALFWPDIYFPDAIYGLLYAILTFIPLIVLIRSERLIKPSVRFVFVGIIETIVIFLFLMVMTVRV
jgi:hypothetical protein